MTPSPSTSPTRFAKTGCSLAATAASSCFPERRERFQEVFQAATPLYYASDDALLPPLVLVDEQHWNETLPVWPALQAMAVGRPMERSIHLVDNVEAVAPLMAGRVT